MASGGPKPTNSLRFVEWMWKSNSNPFSENEKAEWNHYSDVQNLIIEEAYQENQSRVEIDGYYIDLKSSVQISKTDDYKQRPVKRVERKREEKHLRETRFMDLPVANGHTYSGQYGWISPFIVEVRRDLKLNEDALPSNEPSMIPDLVEKAAQGIVQEGTHMEKKCEAEKLANMLRKHKNGTMKQVWECCVYLYTLESFLYQILNGTMRLVGDKDSEAIWRSKVRTLGPFCLLLWDDPFNTKVTKNKTLYRGANLTPNMIEKYKDMVNKKDQYGDYEYGSFQSFTSTSRNKSKAQKFGNTLFTMEVEYAFIADLSHLSEYQEEEEELVVPGVCFRVHDVKYNWRKKKYSIYLKLRQRFSSKSYIFLANIFRTMIG